MRFSHRAAGLALALMSSLSHAETTVIDIAG